MSHYLRGGPRIIDATSYYLQARAIAHGHLAFCRVTAQLLREPLSAAQRAALLSVIFPPGYATVLAAGFLARAPMLVGPVLAALIVLDYARAGARSQRTPRRRSRSGGAFSAVRRAALPHRRYHAAWAMCAVLAKGAHGAPCQALGRAERLHSAG